MPTSTPLPGTPAVTVEADVPCVMPDDVTLFADVYRPAGDGPFPVILMRTPYDKTAGQFGIYHDPAAYARHGYLVVIQDCRGRYRSEGEWYPFRTEMSDGYATVEWAARLPGANGRVGMYGASYAGATQLLAAVMQPPSLVTIIPAVTGSQYYEGWTYRGGALSLSFVASWATQLAQNTAARAGDNPALLQLRQDFANAPARYDHLPLVTYPPLAGEWAPYFHDWLAHPTDDDYWRQWSVDADFSRIRVPALHLAGWYDIFVAGSVANFLGLRASAGSEHARRHQKLLIGPWYHLPWLPVDGSPDPNAGPLATDDWHLRWFNHFLQDESTGVLESPVTVYLQGASQWRELADWPPPASTPTPFYLHSDGRANSSSGSGRLDPAPPAVDELVDTFIYDPAGPVISVGGHSCCFPHVAPMGPADQASRERQFGVLVYTTGPFAAPVDLLGNVTVVLHATTSAVDTDWTARLCWVDPNHTSLNLAEGIIRARFRESLREPSLLTPNETYRYTIDLGPVGVRIAAGDRLRLTIASSDFPQWDRNLNTGGPLYQEPLTAAIVARQTIWHDAVRPSHVILPVVSPGADADEGAAGASQ